MSVYRELTGQELHSRLKEAHLQVSRAHAIMEAALDNLERLQEELRQRRAASA